MAVSEATPMPTPVLTPSVFEMGSYSVKGFRVDTSSDVSSPPPKPLYITTPTTEGTYSVLQFHHGTCCRNSSYSEILVHISSHGFIVVAPQCYTCCFVNGQTEVNSAAKVINWLSGGLQPLLPENVQPDLQNLALAGHSCGGKAAFCLALSLADPPLNLIPKALIGLDPVAGTSINNRIDPKILTYVPRSFNLGIPVAVIGTGLGSDRKFFLASPCAPEGVNHCQFFSECKLPCCYFLATEYGHMDVLDDTMSVLGGCVCKSGKGCKVSMRKAVAGIIASFLKAYLENEDRDFLAIIDNPAVAPIKLDPVLYIRK